MKVGSEREAQEIMEAIIQQQVVTLIPLVDLQVEQHII